METIFLLLYALSAILAVITAGKLKSGSSAGTICRMLVPFLLFNMTITAVSNWGGTLGLTPVKIFHKGYYNHMEESHELLVSYGNEKIWDVLAENPRNRVVVFGEQPEMLRFRAAPRAIRTSREAAETSICHPARRHWQSSLHSREWIISISEADT